MSGDPKSGRKGAAGDNKALNNQLAVAKENLDTTRRDNAELKSRMTDLQSQLDKLQRLIQLKNDQLAKMQAQSGTAPAAADTAPGTSPALPAALVAAAPAPGAEVPVKPAGEIAPKMRCPLRLKRQRPLKRRPLPLHLALVENADTDSAMSKLLASPLLLGLVGGGALVIILLLLLLLARRRNARQEAEKHKRMARALAEESEFASDMDLPETSFEGLDVPPPSVKLAPVPVTVPAPVIADPVRERSTDVLDQASVHVANGRLNQAAELLEEAIKDEPQRSELRLKLMEIYAEQGDSSGFTAQERKLVANGKNHAEVEQLKSRFPMMLMAGAGLGAAALAAEMHADYVKDLMLDESETPSPAPVPEIAPAPAPAPVAAPVVTPAPAVVPPVDELDPFDQDFDLSLDDLEEASPAIVEDRTVPVLDEPTLDDDELSFESVLRQQNEAKQSPPEDLADFDLAFRKSRLQRPPRMISSSASKMTCAICPRLMTRLRLIQLRTLKSLKTITTCLTTSTCRCRMTSTLTPHPTPSPLNSTTSTRNWIVCLSAWISRRWPSHSRRRPVSPLKMHWMQMTSLNSISLRAPTKRRPSLIWHVPTSKWATVTVPETFLMKWSVRVMKPRKPKHGTCSPA